MDPADAQPRASIREQEWTVSPAAEKDLEQLPQIRREQDPTVVGRLTLANREGALPCLHATNDVRDYGVGKAIENVPRLRTTLQAMIDRYLDVQQDILETFLDRGQLRQLTQPTLLPSGKRLPGLHLDQPRLLALMQALVRFSHLAAGDTFSTREIHPQTAEALGRPVSDYPLGALRYDLSKLRAKGLVDKLPQSRRYRLLPHGYQICLVFVKLVEKIYGPLTAGILTPIPGDAVLPPERISPLDTLYRAVTDALDRLVGALGLKVA